MVDKKENVEALISAIATMTSEQRAQVRGKLKFWEDGDETEAIEEEISNGPSEYDDLFILFYDTLSVQLKRRGLSVLPPLSRLSTVPKLYRGAMQGWKRISFFVDKNFGRQHKRERMKLYNLFAEILLWNLGEQGIEITPSSVLTGMQRIPSMVDAQFPGYAETVGLSVILKMGNPTTFVDDEDWSNE